MRKCLILSVALVFVTSLGCGRPDTSVVQQEQAQTQADLDSYEASMNPPDSK